MIDHGFVFNGPHWELQDAPLQGLAPRPLVYEAVKSWDDFQPWLDQVLHFPEEVVDQARRQVPPQWLDGDEPALDDAARQPPAAPPRVPDSHRRLPPRARRPFSELEVSAPGANQGSYRMVW